MVNFIIRKEFISQCLAGGRVTCQSSSFLTFQRCILRDYDAESRILNLTEL